MKKAFYLLLTFSLSLGFVGCSNDDDDENGKKNGEGDGTNTEYYNPIEGEWLEEAGYVKEIFSQRFTWSEMRKHGTLGWQYTMVSMPYTIDKDSFKASGRTYKYKVDGDILEITLLSGKISRYTRIK
jgi:hypothetical protein